MDKNEPKEEKIAKVKIHFNGARPKDGLNHPAVFFVGDKPRVGSSFKFKLDNGVIYSGIVSEAEEIDGKVYVEFKDGIKPV